MTNLVLKIANHLDNVSAAAVAATQFLESKEASPEVIFAANLAIEELVSNIIKYAYDDTLNHEITVRLTLNENALCIEIHDDGKEFNPFYHPEPDLSSGGPQVGGLGIHLVRNMLDTCSYERRGGTNVIKLTKRL